MSGLQDGPLQQAARAKKAFKKKFPTFEEGSLEDSGSTPDGLSPDYDDSNADLLSRMVHQHSRSSDAVKLRPPRRKAGGLRHSTDTIHMVASSSSDSEGEFGSAAVRRSGPRRRNGGSGSAGSKQLLPQQSHHMKQGSHIEDHLSSFQQDAPYSHKMSHSVEDIIEGRGPQIKRLQLVRDQSGSLGIGIVGGGQSIDPKSPKIKGIFIKSINPILQQQIKGKLKPKDQILEVQIYINILEV